MIDTLRQLVRPLGSLASADLLTGGQFATTYRVTMADGTRVVVKTAPVGTDQLLTYEHDLLRAEAMVYGLASEVPVLLMPRVLLTDFSRTLLPSDVLVVSHLPGVPMVDSGLADDDPRTMRDLGAVMAALHQLTGEAFGYPSAPAPTWRVAFERMVDDLLADAERWSVDVPAEAVRAAVARHADLLTSVDRPALVHTDLWAGNLFVLPETGELVGVIDPERALWGDPLLELVGLHQMRRDPPPPALLEGYGPGLDVTSPSARTRLELYRMRHCLVMAIEITPRKFEGDWVGAHRATVTANLHAALAALA